MILTPILGALAYEQNNKGEKVHGIAAAHGPVAIVTAGLSALPCCRYHSDSENAVRLPNRISLFLLTLSSFALGDSQWIVQQCTLTYHMLRPLHTTEGVNHAARGKGACHAGQRLSYRCPRKVVRFR
jgi:hypothetical protein